MRRLNNSSNLLRRQSKGFDWSYKDTVCGSEPKAISRGPADPREVMSSTDIGQAQFVTITPVHNASRGGRIKSQRRLELAKTKLLLFLLPAIRWREARCSFVLMARRRLLNC
jgi:hypothetical protein